MRPGIFGGIGIRTGEKVGGQELLLDHVLAALTVKVGEEQCGVKALLELGAALENFSALFLWHGGVLLSIEDLFGSQ